MTDEYAVYAAIGAIAGITVAALVLGVADGLVVAAITALATLGGIKLAGRGNDGQEDTREGTGN